MMTRFSLVAIGLWVMVFAAPHLLAADAASPAELRCVAIIANASLQKSGFADLLGNELQQAGFALVEREQLNKLVQEQSLALAAGSDAAGQRVELGRLVRADALVLLEDEGSNDERMVRIVIAECRQGARLLSERIHFGRDTAALAQKLAARVVQTRARFSGGIKGIIAVTPFIASDFTYEYHEFQQGYAVMLREALGELPGIAVLDVDEALAIRKELKIAGASAAGVVPLFVNGEFEVGGTADQPRVRFNITFLNPAGPRKVRRENLTLEEASKFLSRDLPAEIMPAYREAADHPFTPAEEFTKLAGRAEQFALLGEWRHAADLRQAALALRPRDVEQRNKLYHDCQTFIQSLQSSPYYARRCPQWEQATRGAAGYYETALELLEWKIRAHHDHPTGIPVGGGDANSIHFLAGSGAARAAQPAKRDFVLHVYPLTWEKSWTNATDETELLHRFYWVDILLSIALDSGGDRLARDDYELLQRIVDDIIPPGIPPSHRLTGLLWGNNPDDIQARSSPQFLEFLDKLKTSKNPIYRLLAREAFLNWQVTHGAVLTVDLRREEENIRSEYLALNVPKIGGRSSGVIEQLDWLREQLNKPAGAAGHIAPATLPTGIVGAAQNFAHFPGERDIVLPDQPPATIDIGALHFENLSLRRKLPNGDFLPPKLLHYALPACLTQCGDQPDILWEGGVWMMSQPGLLQRLPLQLTPRSKPYDVKWDGQHLWIATAREGLWVLDPGGKIVARVGEAEGLPPCDQAARIAVLGPDLLIVVGSFGPSRRAFMATIEKAGDRYRANTFFKASRAMTETWMGGEFVDIELGFGPGEIARCPSPSGGDYLVVRRDYSSLGARTHPLIVDLKTLSVCVSKTAIGPFPFLQVDGGLIQSTPLDTGFTLWHPTEDGKGLATDFAALLLPSNRRHPSLGPNNPAWTLGRDGMVYQPGYDWYRIDPRTMTACCLAKDGPLSDWRHHIAESRDGLIWWGVVGAKIFGMYRVVVDEEKVKQLPPSAFFHAERLK